MVRGQSAPNRAPILSNDLRRHGRLEGRSKLRYHEIGYLHVGPGERGAAGLHRTGRTMVSEISGDTIVWVDNRNSATTGWDIYKADSKHTKLRRGGGQQHHPVHHDSGAELYW